MAEERVRISLTLCMCQEYSCVFLSGRRPCWLRLSRHWSSCWVGGTLCCPSLGSVISGKRWCLSGWPLDSTDTGWTLWQVRETFTKQFILFISLFSSVLFLPFLTVCCYK